MHRVAFALAAVLVVAAHPHPAGGAADDDDALVGTWERLIEKGEKEELEETWVIRKTKDGWAVSGNYFERWREVGNFKGKDVKYADGTLAFTQEFFKLPKGIDKAAKVTASAEGDRLDVVLKKGSAETRVTLKRAGDAAEVVGTWTANTFGMKETWTVEKGEKGALAVRGTFTKGDAEVGSWKGVNVRYFMRVLGFNQQFDKLPTKTWVNGVAVAGVGRGGEFVYVWTNGKLQGKGKVTRAGGI
jgi:hypothetical protein